MCSHTFRAPQPTRNLLLAGKLDRSELDDAFRADTAKPQNLIADDPPGRAPVKQAIEKWAGVSEVMIASAVLPFSSLSLATFPL